MKFILMFLWVFGMFLNVNAQGKENSLFVNDSLDRYIVQALDVWQIPGAAVYIVKEGKVLVQKGYGFANFDTKSRVDEQTVFPIASVTKTFTGTLLATLEAEGKITLNDRVKKWLPEFSMNDKLYEQQITLADVLSHRSGWKTFQGDFLNTESSLSYPLMIEKFCLQQPAFPIRSKFGYSNFGFIIAGECVENITKQSWNAFLYNRFLLPLNMKRTLIFEEEIKNEKNRSAGHTLVDDSVIVLPPDKVEPYSHGGVYSSIQDLGTWINVLLNNGIYNNENVIPESAIEKMWYSYTIIGKPRAADRKRYLKTYGLGWEIVQYQGTEVISHGGAYSGALASLTLVPDLGLGIVVLTNRDNHMFQETLKWQVIDAFLNKNAPNYTLAEMERQKQREQENDYRHSDVRVETEEFETDMDAITGTYTSVFYGKASIKKDGENYILTLEHHPQLKGILTAYKKNQLICAYNHPMFGKVPFTFVVKNKKVKSFTLYVDDFVEADGYEFKKQTAWRVLLK